MLVKKTVFLGGCSNEIVKVTNFCIVNVCIAVFGSNGFHYVLIASRLCILSMTSLKIMTKNYKFLHLITILLLSLSNFSMLKGIHRSVWKVLLT